LDQLPTGCAPLDDILGGGFRFGAVSLIYGEAATGKTTLAMSCVANHLEADRWAKAYYLDADGKLSTRRLLQVAKGDESILERLLIWRPSDFREQTTLIEALPNLLPTERTPVVVDSVTGPYRLETSGSRRTFMANKELNRQLGFLAETAKTRDAAVLIVGQVRSVLDAEVPTVEPVARRLLGYWSDTVLKLETISVNSIRQATLEKPANTPLACRFRLGESGLEEVVQEW
jgi:DNA repair protein RadB